MDKMKDKREKGNINKEEITIKHCTLIESLNSLTSLSWSRHLSQPTLRRRCERRKEKVCLPKRKRVGVATNIYLRKTLKKTKKMCEF